MNLTRRLFPGGLAASAAGAARAQHQDHGGFQSAYHEALTLA